MEPVEMLEGKREANLPVAGTLAHMFASQKKV